MPNSIGPNGLQIKSRAEVVADILDGTDANPGLRQIYGPDINVDPNTPDGQLVNLFAQSIVDVLEFLAQAYNSFDPDQAVGVNLDLRCAINGVVRNPGSYTIVYMTLVVNRAMHFVGLDEDPLACFKVADAANNTYSLVTSFNSGLGTLHQNFRADLLGPLNPAIHTLTRVATPQLGVVSVDNPSVPVTVGTTEESDYSLRIRRSNSVSLPSTGYFEGLYGALLDILDVTSVRVIENDTASTDANGIPSHSIWVIVAGGLDQSIGQVIYLKRNAGCGMKGSVDVSIVQVDGSTFHVFFDRPTPENLYIKATLTAVTGVTDPTYVAAQILANITYQIGQAADASAINAYIKSIAPNVSVSDCMVSDDGSTWVDLLDVTAVNNQWALAAGRITIT